MLTFKIRVSELEGYKYMRIVYEIYFLKLSVIIMLLLVNWKVYSIQIGTILSAKYLTIKKLAKISSSGNLNRIYKFYGGRILINEAGFHINQYCISQQTISLLSQLQKNSIFFNSSVN